MSDNDQPRYWSDFPRDAQGRGFARPSGDARQGQQPPHPAPQQRYPMGQSPRQQTPPQNPRPDQQGPQSPGRPKYRPQRPNPASDAARYQQVSSQQQWSTSSSDAAQQPKEQKRLVGPITWWAMLVFSIVMLGFASVWVIPQRSTAIVPHLAVLYVAFAIYLVVQWLIPSREWARYVLAMSIPLFALILALAIQHYGVLWFAFAVGGAIGAVFGWFTVEAFKPVPEKSDTRRGR